MGRGMHHQITAAATLTLLPAVGGSPGLFAAQQPATWLGGSGNCTDATKWSNGVVPNNNATDTYAVNTTTGKFSTRVRRRRGR